MNTQEALNVLRNITTTDEQKEAIAVLQGALPNHWIPEPDVTLIAGLEVNNGDALEGLAINSDYKAPTEPQDLTQGGVIWDETVNIPAPQVLGSGGVEGQEGIEGASLTNASTDTANIDVPNTTTGNEYKPDGL